VTRVLITGAAGYVGSRLSAFLSQRGDQVAASEGDLLDLHLLTTTVEQAAPAVVIHLAGISSPPICEREPAEAVRSNIAGTASVLEAMRRAAPRARLIFASTAQVYQPPAAGAAPIVITEDHPIEPQNLYARTKWAAEQLIADSCTADRRATVLRLFNHTHKTQSPEFFLPHLYTTIVRDRVAGARLTVPVGNLEIGRDFGSIQDLVTAFAAVLDRTPANRCEVFNVCSGITMQLSALATLLAERLDAAVDFVIDPARVRAGEPVAIRGAHDRLTAATGWVPRVANERDLIDAFLSD
jgi:GDP-4-dehydro-6-deoxy-D-mannose reductase